MREAIKKFNKQLAFRPKLANPSRFGKFKKFIIVGMGGSNLAAGLVKSWKPELDIIVHRDYGLPADTKNRLVVLSSYSGNTEEVIDALGKALNKKLPVVAIATGGKLLNLAKKRRLPYIQIPDGSIEPRLALGFAVKALLKAMGEESALKELDKLSVSLKPARYENYGKALAKKLQGAVPVIYSSGRNAGLAYNFKVKINETAKIPAFANVFPELNHNEMAGFDMPKSARTQFSRFHFIFLKDKSDDKKIGRRMALTGKIFKERGYEIEMLELKGSPWLKIFGSSLIADWTAYYLARQYGSEPLWVPLIEEFKKRL